MIRFHPRKLVSGVIVILFALLAVTPITGAQVTQYTNPTTWKNAVGTFEARAFDEFYPGVASGGGCLAGAPGPTVNLQYGDVTVRGYTQIPEAKGIAGMVEEQCALTDSATSPQVSDGFIDPFEDAYFEMEFTREVTAFFSFFASLASGEQGSMELFDSGDDSVTTLSIQ